MINFKKKSTIVFIALSIIFVFIVVVVFAPDHGKNSMDKNLTAPPCVPWGDEPCPECTEPIKIECPEPPQIAFNDCKNISGYFVCLGGYTVKEGDSIGRILEDGGLPKFPFGMYNRLWVPMVKDLNNLQGDALEPGQTITVPFVPEGKSFSVIVP